MRDIDHRELIKNFGLEMGMDLQLDDDGFCQLVIDDSRLINVRSHQDDGLIILSAPVAEELPDPVSYPLVLELLDYALGPCFLKGGNCPVVGRDSESDAVVMYMVVTASVLSEKKFIDIFTEFLSEIESFDEMISENFAGNSDFSSKSLDSNLNFPGVFSKHPIFSKILLHF
jgi:hypothetical protein